MSPLEKSRLTHHEMLEMTVCTYQKNITYFLHDLDKNHIRLIFCILKSEISSQKNGSTQKSTHKFCDNKQKQVNNSLDRINGELKLTFSLQKVGHAITHAQ